jgi:nicotinate-nucleotide pyrophosphorylase (carboxylating)
VRRIVREALDEDVGEGDVTTLATVPEDARARGTLLAKQELVVAGLEVAVTAFRLLDPEVVWEPSRDEGERVGPGETLGRISGRAQALLAGERVALNFLQRLCGVATLTRRFVEAVAGTKARIRDTRKTTPLLRFLEKHAVEVGGGLAHRPSLDAAVLVKDNHARLVGSVGEAARRAVAGAGGLEVEVEIESVAQVDEALGSGAGMILLDNFTPQQVREAVARIAGRVPVEVSGGVRLENVRAYAEAGCEFIAIGALTHSAPGVDISLELEPSP